MDCIKKNESINIDIQTIFTLINQVDKYSDFLPWCNDIIIKEKTQKYIITEVKVGFQNINEKYLCKVLLYPKKRILLDYISGPFEYLEIDWKFSKISKNKTEVNFFCNFRFQSLFLRLCTSFFLEKAVKKMVGAFEKKLNN